MYVSSIVILGFMAKLKKIDLKKISCTENFIIFTQFLCSGIKLLRVGKTDFFKVPRKLYLWFMEMLDETFELLLISVNVILHIEK